MRSKIISKYNLFPKDIKEASLIQDLLKKDLVIKPMKIKPTLVAGVDASYRKGEIVGVYSLFKYPEMEIIEYSVSKVDVSFPYVPGYLSFREGPAILSAMNKSRHKADVIIFDGQGIAHPKGLGIASHIGVVLNLPTIGCAKSCLVGEYKGLGLERGAYVPLIYKKKMVGAVVRTRSGIKPLFISPGHLIDIESSIEIILNCCKRYRLPEPIRHADRVSKLIEL
jgi:deoxyribonuclease V